MVDIRTYCHAARLAAFSCPQKHWNALIFRGAQMLVRGDKILSKVNFWRQQFCYMRVFFFHLSAKA
jgi:hypothetical protein